VPLFLGSVASFFDRRPRRAVSQPHRRRRGSRIVAAARGVLARSPLSCTAPVGKDRTGVVVALMLAAVGVEAVVADYARTEASFFLPSAMRGSSLRCAARTRTRGTSKSSPRDRPPR
jgi:protein-tyrosine phosphatase